jgi:hypothetical protein
MNTEQKDETLWRVAKKRAAFKWSLLSYIGINAFLVGVWYYTGAQYFWPIWCMMGWGIGVAFQYFDAYHGDSFFSADKEYEKLKNQSK